MSFVIEEPFRGAQADQQWSVTLDGPANGLSTGGLIPVNIAVETSPAATSEECRLRLSVATQPEPAFEKCLTLQDGRASCALKLHSHLLADGAQRLEFALHDRHGRLRWAHSVSLTVSNRGHIAEQVRQSLRRSGVPLVMEGPCDASRYDFADPSLTPWFDRPDFGRTIQQRLQAGMITLHEAESLTAFVADGYLALPSLIEDALLEAVNWEIDHAIAIGYQGYVNGTGQRIQHLHDVYPSVRALWMHPLILHWLDLIFDAVARPCQTLTFPFGSEQRAHQDTIHLTPFPAGYMCGVWIALEDVQPGSGELEVYPGSHRLPRVYMCDTGCAKVTGGDWSEFARQVEQRWQVMREEAGLEKLVYRPRRGSVLIWHENLMHGGGPRTVRSLSRRSMVTHNFAEGALVFYDSTGHVGYTFGRPVTVPPR